MVYTDASGGPNNQWAHLRIVGQASVIVHPITHHCLWVLLGGTEGPQTVPAGELQAVVSFIQHLREQLQGRDYHTTVVLHTDSKYVCNHWRRGSSDTQANTKLWKAFWGAENDPQFTITLRKVAAHKTLRGVESGDIELIDYIGNDLADQGANRVAQHMSYPTTIRAPADANLYLIKAYQRRLVEINIHCIKKFPHPARPKRKPVTRQLFAERLRELILSSEHPHIVYDDRTRRWHCSHCQLNLLTHPLYEHLRRTLHCRGMLTILAQGQRLDRPIPLFQQGGPP